MVAFKSLVLLLYPDFTVCIPSSTLVRFLYGLFWLFVFVITTAIPRGSCYDARCIDPAKAPLLNLYANNDVLQA